MSSTHVQILAFDGCPNELGAVELVERALLQAGVDATVERIRVADPADADRLRFLGSPTIRVDGRDVEPGADERGGFSFACRVYQVEGRLQGLPASSWVTDALLAARSQ